LKSPTPLEREGPHLEGGGCLKVKGKKLEFRELSTPKERREGQKKGEKRWPYQNSGTGGKPFTKGRGAGYEKGDRGADLTYKKKKTTKRKGTSS